VTEAATEAVEGAAEAAGDAAAAVTEAAGDAAAAVTEAVPLDQLLDPANFNLDAVVGAIDASPLDAALKTQLKTAVRAAQNSETLLPEVLKRIRMALGG
jgi:hypothetical protein